MHYTKNLVMPSIIERFLLKNVIIVWLYIKNKKMIFQYFHHYTKPFNINS